MSRREHHQQVHDQSLADETVLREANEQLLLSAIREQELAEAAERAKNEACAAKRELEEIAEFRERLIGIVGHDLRTPLSAILLSATMLSYRRESTDDPDVNRILRSARRMDTMVRQLLDVTRARLSGGIPVLGGPTDLVALVTSLIDEFDVTHPTRPIQFCGAPAVKGWWDGGRLAQVISNLLGNALEHGDPQSWVKVRVWEENEDVVLEVENEGKQISRELLSDLFDPFRQGSPDKRGSGLGLGLYISRQIMIAHGGTLEAESAESGTTVFRARLPHQPIPERE